MRRSNKFRKDKRGAGFNFAWLFAIAVGAIIIFISIYAASKFVVTKRYEIDTATAKQLSIIFEPMETGLATGKSSSVEMTDITRIYNDCFSGGSFGKNIIKLSTKQGIGGDWQEPGGDISVPNKYVFSRNMEEGRTVYFFSKPLNMPWKVSSLIFMTTSQYCFVGAPEEIKEDIVFLGDNLNIPPNCTERDIKVCFDSGTNCDITVTGNCISDCDNIYDSGIVKKNSKTMEYSGNLLYGAIFSNKSIYECNLERLMSRLVRQANLYQREVAYLSNKCNSLPHGLSSLVNFARSKDLHGLRIKAKEVDDINDASQCSLW